MTETPPSPSWESAPLPPGLPPGHEPSDGGGMGGDGPVQGGALLPWEDEGAGNGIERFLGTLKMLLISPVEAFDRVGNSEALGRPIAFGIIVSTAAQLVTVGYQAMFGSVGALLGALAARGTATATPAPSPLGHFGETGIQLAFAVLMPLFFVIGLVLGAAVNHVCLMIFGGANRSFSQTMRALCYATSTNVLVLVPIMGPFVAAIWTLVLHVIGLARVHRTTYAKSALSVFAPMLLACVCGGAAMVVLFGALFAALKP